MLAMCAMGGPALAQHGVADDRVVLPDGPGSLEGVGGAVSVSGNQGDMSWSIPIQLTPGFKQATPTLSLNYSSSAGSGTLGIGWNLSGLSCLSRDTWRGLPRYTPADDFTIDGDQLVRVADDPPTYRARYEGDFARYQWLEAGDGSEGYWLRETPDGVRTFFGADAQGGLVADARASDPARGGTYRYCPVETRDVFDHALRVEYMRDGRVPLPVRVGWVYPEGAEEPTYAVTFEYEARADETGGSEQSVALGGFDLRLTQRLAQVRVFSRGQPIRAYRLRYESYADAGGFTRLVQVERTGADGSVYPIRFDFTYSRALGGVCGPGACEEPYMVAMGQVGAGLDSGRVSLVDINGDSLPDVLYTPLDQNHRFFVNQADGQGRSAFLPASNSAFGGADWQMDSGSTQLLDVNGDGFADLIQARTGRVLLNRGTGDWAEEASLANAARLPNFEEGFELGDLELNNLQFLDFDHDKRIDVLTSTVGVTQVFRNAPDAGFELQNDVVPLGVDLAESGLQFADMNGDGLLDPVQLLTNRVRYRINFGFGRWSDWRDLEGVALAREELDDASLEDLNGDGLADLVVVRGQEVRYSLNRSGERFFYTGTLTPAEVPGLPAVGAGVTALFADMNGNGSTDVVWVDRQGRVDYLELFPVRPNLLSRIENGIGMVMDITYATSASLRATAQTDWAHPLPHAMQVVVEVDTWDRLSNDHELDRFGYADGYYDGLNRQFRGYQRVERIRVGDETSAEGRTIEVYDVGAADPYRHGLLLSQTRYSLGAEIDHSETEYADCPLAQVPGNLPDLQVRWQCAVAERTTIKEGLAEAQWYETETRMSHDGYGNVTRQANLGVVAGNCGACDRDAGVFGTPCGPQCVGDEQYTETTYAEPGVFWLLNLPVNEQTYGREGGLRTETQSYYDGPDFVGLPAGQAAQGKLSRVMRRVAGNQFLAAQRSRFDPHGNVVEALDPEGEPGTLGHRRTYAYDAEGLRVARTELDLGDYRLRRDTQYERVFDQVSESTAWMRVEGEQPQSPRRSSFFTYDAFGRLASRVLPGNDTLANPTEVYAYELASPVSRLVTRRRSQEGGQLDLESARCVDGRGRTIQSRTRLAQGRYQVTGFTLYDTQSAPKAVYQPFIGASGACDQTVPEGVLAQRYTYDGVERQVTVTEPDASLYGAPTVRRMEYAPLRTLTFDGEDTDASSPYADTPTVDFKDGMGRLVAVERRLTPQSGATTRFTYDELGRMRGYIDADGNEKVQTYDLAGRIIEVEDPNSGRSTREYDDAGNLVGWVDARGEMVAQAFDGQNRLIGRWDPAREAESRIEWTYDAVEGCPLAACSNPEGMLVQATWPGGSERIGYDQRSRPIRVARILDGFEFVVTNELDNADRVRATTYPDGRTLRRSYDDASRLTAIDGVLTLIEYDDRGQVTQADSSDGTVNAWTFDARMRLAQHEVRGGAGPLQGWAYDRDREGNLRRIDDLAGDAAQAEYRHDAWYRVTQAALAGETLDYQFDAIDNVRSQASSLGADSPGHVGDMGYGEGGGPNAVTSAGPGSYAYDAAGYLTDRDDQPLLWDAQGRLLSVGAVHSADYGAGAGRVAKTESGSRTLYAHPDFVVRDGVSQLYVRLGRDRVARYDSAALAPQMFEDANGNEQIDAGDAWLAEGDAVDRALWSAVRRLQVEAGPALTHLHHDHLGNLTLATAGEVRGQRHFYPTGKVRPGATGWVDEHGFTGQEQDASGLIHFQYRALDPHTGRWISADPAFAVLAAGNAKRHGEATTAYAYVANHFDVSVDPTGLSRIGRAMRALKRVFGGGRRGGRGGRATAAHSSRSLAGSSGRGGDRGGAMANPLAGARGHGNVHGKPEGGNSQPPDASPAGQGHDRSQTGPQANQYDSVSSALGHSGPYDSVSSALGNSGPYDSVSSALGNSGPYDSVSSALGNSGPYDSVSSALGNAGQYSTLRLAPASQYDASPPGGQAF